MRLDPNKNQLPKLQLLRTFSFWFKVTGGAKLNEAKNGYLIQRQKSDKIFFPGDCILSVLNTDI